MVYGICYCPISFMEELKNLGFAGLYLFFFLHKNTSIFDM